MYICKAKEIALEWTDNFIKDTSVVGAMFNGSVVDLDGNDILSPSSDIDINFIVDEARRMDKIGKIMYKGVLLDVSFIPLDMIRPVEKVLSTYEIANCFHRNSIIYDPTGYLAEAALFSSQNFAHPKWVLERCENVYRKIERGIQGFQVSQPLLDNINSWLFPAGICTHAILVAALQNPTVRLRYLRVRSVLEGWNQSGFYETLLELLGCSHIPADRVQRHLDHLEKVYASAIRHKKSHFIFENDVSAAAKPVVIQGSQTLIDEGNHREAVFWMAVTSERCHKILRQDAPEEHEKYYPDFINLLMDLGVETNKKIQSRIQAIESFIPTLRGLTDKYISQTL